MAKSKSKKSNTSWLWMFAGMFIGFSLFSLGYIFLSEYDNKHTLKAFQEQLQDIRAAYPSAKAKTDETNLEFYRTLNHKHSPKPQKTQTSVPVVVSKNIHQNLKKDKPKKPDGNKTPLNREVENTNRHTQKDIKTPGKTNSVKSVTKMENDSTITLARVDRHIPKPKSFGTNRSAGYLLQAGAFKKPEQAKHLRRKIGNLGLISYIQIAQVNSSTYHRVRLGPFSNQSDMKKAIVTLKANKIPAIQVR